jgi:hypothetical protein
MFQLRFTRLIQLVSGFPRVVEQAERGRRRGLATMHGFILIQRINIPEIMYLFLQRGHQLTPFIVAVLEVKVEPY